MSTIREHMSDHPHTIGSDQPIAEAARRMREHHVRHLPVLEGGTLVGMLSDRDVQLGEALGAGGSVRVADAMAPETYSVAPDSDVADVVSHMAAHRLGSAVVMQGAKVVGIFTATDAMRMLARALVVDGVREEMARGAKG